MALIPNIFQINVLHCWVSSEKHLLLFPLLRRLFPGVLRRKQREKRRSNYSARIPISVRGRRADCEGEDIAVNMFSSFFFLSFHRSLFSFSYSPALD